MIHLQKLDTFGGVWFIWQKGGNFVYTLVFTSKGFFFFQKFFTKEYFGNIFIRYIVEGIFRKLNGFAKQSEGIYLLY